MNHYDSAEIDKYLIEFENNATLYENDLEKFIQQQNIESQYAQQLRETLHLSQNIDLLSGASDAGPREQQQAEDLTNDFGGEYRFIRELGRGGMGTVWLAEQLMPLREVAVKLILTDLDSRLVQRRFEAEQQSLALMEHAGIAKVIDAGAIEGKRPYFVMEYVDGTPITNYCNDNRLSLEDRLALFLQLCDAIQHAHQKGVIHRDVKPGNILVTQIDGMPHVKVIDFGLAKITSGQGANLELTQANVALGSPLWMSPEQTQWKYKDGQSRVDTRSDVYSLGVILYQLLTNTTPIASNRFEDADRIQLFDAIRNEVPPYPSRRITESKESSSWLESQSSSGVSGWRNTLRDDLDWVTMKAIEKEPDRRYATVSALADDIRRFISGNAVVARPPSTAYQLKKYIGRNRAASIATAIAVVSLIACSAIFVWSAMAAVRERERVDGLLELFVNEIEAANIYESGIRFSEENRNRLVRFVKEIDNLPLRGSPKLEFKLRMPLANSLVSLGEVNLARSEYQKVLEVAKTQLGNSDPATIDARNKFAFIHLARDENEEAKNLLNENLKLISEVNVASELQLECELGLANSLDTHKDVKHAIADYRRIISNCKSQLPEGHTLTIRGLELLGQALSSRGEFEEADRLLKEAKSLSDRFLGTDSARSLGLGIDIRVNEVDWKSKLFSVDDRLEYLDEIVAKLGESNPRVLILRSEIAESLLPQLNIEEALLVVEDGILACKNNASDRKFELATLWFMKLKSFYTGGRFGECVECYENDVVPNLSDCIREDSDLNVRIQYAAVRGYHGIENFERAEELIATYEPIAKQVEGSYGIIRNNLRKQAASILQEKGRYDEAVNIYKDIFVERLSDFGEFSRDACVANYDLGIALHLAGRQDDALKAFERASQVARKVFDTGWSSVKCKMEMVLTEQYLYSNQIQRSFDAGEALLEVLWPTEKYKDLNVVRFKAQICQAESAARLGKVDVGKQLLAKARKGAEKFDYLRKSSYMSRLNLIEGIFSFEDGEFEKAEELLIGGLKAVIASRSPDRSDLIQDTLTSRRYASQLARLFEKSGQPDKAMQYRDMKFSFDDM